MSSTTSRNDNYPQKKIQQIKEIEDLLLKYKIIGLTNLEGVSSNVLQKIRKSLHGDTEIKVAKNTLKRIAINNAASKKKQVKKLIDHINGNSAFIFSKRNPFALQKYFNANRVAVAAKPGQIATEDIWISAGVTEMTPGPVIGELNSIGLRTSVEAGKIKINQDTKVLGAGEPISETHASIFSKLDIKPLKMGIALSLAMEETGEILFEKDLNVDEDAIMNQLIQAYTSAFNLSLSTGYPTKDNISSLLSLGHAYAFNLSLATGYPTKETIASLLAKARSEAEALSNLQ
jgi:large subunit ribosomal protein L10